MTEKTRIVLEAVNKTKAAFGQVERSMSGLEVSVRRAQMAFGLLIGAGAVGGAIKSVAQAGIQMQRFERGLRAATGSAEAGAREMQFVRDEADRLGLNLLSTADAYTSLAAAARGTSLEGEQARKIFTSVSEASRVLGLSAEQTEGALRAIEQMISKGNVQAEELRGQLGERLPGAFQIAARAIGKSTEELNDMLDRGEVLASDLLPKLADELSKTFGSELASATSDAQAAFNRLDNALLDLKVTIAESGLLDSLAFLAEKMAAIGKDGTLEERLLKLRGELLQFENRGVTSGEAVERLRIQIEILQDRIALANREIGGGDGLSEIIVTAKKRTSDYEKELEKFSDRFETAAQKAAKLRAELNRFKDELTEGQRALVEGEIDDILTGGLEEIVIDVKKRFTKPVKKEFDEIEEASRQAARNIQDAFADFLFDPFEDGVRGMVKSFLDAIRRMLANQAAIQLFKFIGGVFGSKEPVGKGTKDTGGSNKLAFAGAFAQGGSFTVPGSGGTDTTGVFFRATPGENVTVTKPGQSSGGISIVNNIQIDGADPERAAELVRQGAEQGSSLAISRIMDLRRKGRF